MQRSVRYTLAMIMLVVASMASARPGEGDVPPDYLGRDRSGNEIHVSALRGKVVIVTFWASWCGYCMKELPILAAIQKLAGPAQLQVVAVSHDDSLDIFTKIRNKLKDLDLILTYDAGDQRIAKPYGVKGIPHMVMIGRDGRIAHTHVGYGEDMLDDIASEINELLAAPAPPTNAAPASPAAVASP